jgi:hypothetical protein
VNETHLRWAHRAFERPICSTECVRTDIKARFACCDKAEFLGCGCMYAFTCDVHGEKHLGTHD